MPVKGKTVDAYIASFPRDVQPKLESIRQTVLKAVPEAEESISYQMPAYKYHGMLLYFAGFKDHLSLFAAGSQAVRKEFEKELSGYIMSKGTIRFPLAKPVPVKLIRDIALFRVKENLAREKEKKAGDAGSSGKKPRKR